VVKEYWVKTNNADFDVVTPTNEANHKIIPELTGISETMLWALHNRASEAKRADGVLIDPDCVRIHDAIDYDFTRHFGEPQGSLSVRAAEIDRVIRLWLERHPDGLVVSLGEGLETQLRRVDNGRMRWLSVDLPDAIRIREVFLPPTERFCHISVSALDPKWMDAVDSSSDVFIVAQGLLMYLKPEKVQKLLSDIADRFPGAEIVFDVVPRWFSRMTMSGLQHTPHYRLPPMPWGINQDEVEPTMKRWNPRLASSIEFLVYRAPRGMSLLFARAGGSIPFLRHEVPSLLHVRIPETVCQLSVPDTDTVRSIEPLPVDDCDPDIEATFGGLIAATKREFDQNYNLMIAADKVIGKRVALAMECALAPLSADHDEISGIVPEKVEAFAKASMIMLDGAADANLQLSRLVYDEAMTTNRAALAIATCDNPVAAAVAQANFMLSWFDRMGSNLAAMGMLALSAQNAAMVPISQSVHANVKRLDADVEVRERVQHCSGGGAVARVGLC
jgi:O-methyltransferase involved in polyketide biosynthesis